MNGNWNNYFVCTGKIEPCPICATGDDASHVAVLTIIDHREVKSKDGKKTYKDQKRLFVAKHGTYLYLRTMAEKRGGLAGCTFDVFRSTDKDPNVGDKFDFIEKNEPAQLAQLFTKQVKDEKGNVTGTVTDFVPANYEEEVVYRSSAELNAMGFGSAPVGAADAVQTGGTDYTGQL
jgi:hypothetical protein